VEIRRRRPNPAFLADGRGFAYVASDGETVVGFAWGSTVSQPDGGQLLFLAGLQVAEAVRSTKVGKQLLDAFAEDGRAAGLTRMWMLSDAGHRAARLLYEYANDRAPRRSIPRGGYWDERWLRRAAARGRALR
jgi:predicted N-acetyltransferase YhbS